MSLFKKLMIILFLSLVSTSILSANQNPWTGKWHVYWKHGAIVLTMEQHGNDVNGSYEPNHGVIKGTIKDNGLHVLITDNDQFEHKFLFNLGKTTNSLFGNSSYGDWVTGIKVDEDKEYNSLLVDNSSPMRTFYSFLRFANQARSGHYEALEKALSLLDFKNTKENPPYGKQLLLAQKFFQILNACTVKKFDFKLKTTGDHQHVTLHQAGTANTVEVKFIKINDTQGWKIQLPKEEELVTTLHTLMQARGMIEIDNNANLKLTNPRDTMRTFIEQYKKWNENGKQHIISTMNLSNLDPAIWDWQAPLLAYYLLGTIDRISDHIYQEIPNDPNSKKPFVYFHHPVGDIVIAPYEVEGKIRWQFTPDTLKTIEALFEEMEDIPVKVPTKMIADNDIYFKLKNIAQSISPLLIKKFYDTAFWQIAMLGLVVFLAGWISYFTKVITQILVKKFYLTKRWTDKLVTLRFVHPVQILTFGVILLYGAHQLGLSDFIFSLIKTFSHLMIVISVAWVIFGLIDVIISLFKIRAKKHASQVDDILFSLTRSILRITVVISAIFTVAEIFGIPYKTIIAGLGIGGLAFAIAAKDTIANFFGSAIIIADRPFKAGDKIKIGSNVGVITNVGMRSTLIRTISDTILTVPNNLITSEMIDNYTAREAMRVDTSFFFALDTSKETLDGLDKDIATYLNGHKDVDTNKIILIGVNDYTKRGISFGLSFFVKAATDMEYSDIRHRVITEIAEIIKESGIELVMIRQDTIAD
ncbi:mechanosensitive ion channel family protein [Sulfurovum sp.]|uniref:mechanosensitive ion channel family protein n=1 Tax=Sulfurovum sp. TaxID=1969726 RepID=UPI002867F451|nr:mechanosensitive ion channel family protein [Sulfurovum sp.]